MVRPGAAGLYGTVAATWFSRLGRCSVTSGPCIVMLWSDPQFSSAPRNMSAVMPLPLTASTRASN
eukprot:2128074-Lingulodinium_polyedra.AAC.1